MELYTYYLKTDTQETIFLALENALIAFGVDVSSLDFNTQNKLLQHVTKETVVEEQPQSHKVLLNTDWVQAFLKAKDVNGDYIVTQTDEEGNPIEYQMEPDVHYNVYSNQPLEFAPEVLITPTNPQLQVL